jgi:hypothetical protein
MWRSRNWRLLKWLAIPMADPADPELLMRVGNVGCKVEMEKICSEMRET